MQIGSGNPKNQYLFGGVPLRSVDSEKDLGVVFNSAFKFDDHVKKCIKLMEPLQEILYRGKQALCWACISNW